MKLLEDNLNLTDYIELLPEIEKIAITTKCDSMSREIKRARLALAYLIKEIPFSIEDLEKELNEIPGGKKLFKTLIERLENNI